MNRSHKVNASSRWVIPGSRLLLAFLGRIRRYNKYREVVRYAAKRLPSRRWVIIRSTTFHPSGRDDEDENDSFCDVVSAASDQHGQAG
jgi:hypothetical protein